MADANRSVFNRRATEKLRSPDDLERYVRLTNPSIWVILAACVLLLAGLVVWGIFGAVTTTVSTACVRVDDSLVCFLNVEDATEVNVGDTASVNSMLSSVTYKSEEPISRAEAQDQIPSDFLKDTLVKDDWVFMVLLDATTVKDVDEGTVLTTTITVESKAPLALVIPQGSD